MLGQIHGGKSPRKEKLKVAVKRDQSPSTNQVGSFLATKQVVFSNDELTPGYISDAQRSPKLVDLSLLKKGMHSFDPVKHSIEPEQPSLQPMFSHMHSDNPMPDFSSQDLLTIPDVQLLPPDVDSIVNKFKIVDFAAQDLEVLIELAKQLKARRLELFPDQNYLLSMQDVIRK
jgi:hypothetical protein